MSGFTGFGQSNSGSTTSPFSFGASKANEKEASSSTSIFGGKASLTPTSTNSLFGGASFSPATGASLNPSNPSSTATGTATSSTTNLGTTGTNIFGAKPTPAADSSAVFGPSSTPTSTMTSAGGIFGPKPVESTPDSASPAVKPLFGTFGQSTTPISTPSAPSAATTGLFGAATTKPVSTSLFGGLSGSKSDANTPTMGGLFGTKTGGNPTVTGTSATPVQGGLFSKAGPLGSTAGTSQTLGNLSFPTLPASGAKQDTKTETLKNTTSLFASASPTVEASSPSLTPNPDFSWGNSKSVVGEKKEPPLASGGLFSGGINQNNSQNQATDTTKTTAAVGGLFGTFGGFKPDVAEPSKPGTLSFNMSSKPSTTPADTSRPVESTTTSNSVGATTASSMAKPMTSDSASPTGTISMLGTGTTTPATKTAANPLLTSVGVTSSAVLPTEPAPNLLRGKTIEDIVDSWGKDLDSQTRDFRTQAGEVREWDNVLVRNGNQIATLHRQILEAQQMQASVDRNLDYIESQQKQLDAILNHYEREITGFVEKDTKPLTAKMPADKEREKSYVLAEDLNKQLDDLSRNLSQMIEEVNRLSSSGQSITSSQQQPSTVPTAIDAVSQQFPDDPINQLSAILGAHLRTINSIDSHTGKLGSKVKEIESRMGTGDK